MKPRRTPEVQRAAGWLRDNESRIRESFQRAIAASEENGDNRRAFAGEVKTGVTAGRRRAYLTIGLPVKNGAGAAWVSLRHFDSARPEVETTWRPHPDPAWLATMELENRKFERHPGREAEYRRTLWPGKESLLEEIEEALSDIATTGVLATDIESPFADRMLG